jgi:hypothetical protein
MRSRRRLVRANPILNPPAQRVFALLIVLGLSAAQPGNVRGAIAWETVETVDQPVTEVSSNSGVSALFVDGTWHVVYCSDGEVRHRARDASGWLGVETVSTVPGVARNPHLTWDGTNLFVVWEDDRTGIPEVWVRTWSAGSWSAESCFTEDAVPSRSPAIATCDNHSLLVWQEGDAPSRIMGRKYAGAWQDPMPISASSGSATEPSVGGVPYDVPLQDFVVGWTDTRYGAPEIFVRPFTNPGWGPEIRRTDLPGDCGHPSITLDLDGGDAQLSVYSLCFEYTAPGGVTEVWAACGNNQTPHPLSLDDGIPSTRPGITSFAKWYEQCNWPYESPRPLEVWTDLGGTRQHRVSAARGCPASGDPVEPLSDSGLSTATLAVAEGQPSAPLLALWVEDVAGVPTLLSRRGGVPGCTAYEVANQRPLLIAPEGVPADTLRIVDRCTGAPVPNRSFYLWFSPSLDQDLTWAPLQHHPTVAFATDAEGRAVISLRGGGCSQAGWVSANCGGGLGFAVCNGVKSPDLDGDCAVLEKDIAAVRAALGTDDFCADLDGNGTVELEDVHLVESVLGDRCTDLAGIAAFPGESGLSLSIEPNPCRGPAVFHVRGAASVVTVRIFDVSGRVVRNVGDARRTESAGESRQFNWNGLDDRGRPVPSGVYAIQVSGLSVRTQGSMIVLR